MRKIHISTGKSRFEKSWRIREVKWEQFKAQCQKPVVTKETYAEYMAKPKELQDDIKDVGGFVGGVVAGGRRKVNSVTSRSLLTLDIDDAPLDLFETTQMFYDCEMLMYGTHKHSDKTPRFRLVIPLARDVLPDEHEAIARKVAGNIGIEYFDPTTFQAERLMYWPSISSDVQPYYREQAGPWLNPDDVLAEYVDWTDTSEWPVSEKAKRIVKAGMEKQEDPVTKAGMVGIFCRVYGIDAAIEKFLSEVYAPTGHDDRWTYIHGSTSAGLVVYEDKWCFSHHSTDPTSGRLCNAFDLVRIHLFGDSDDRIDEETPYNKKPSYGKMIQLVAEDEQIKQTMVTDRIEQKTGRVGEDMTWASKLEMDTKGNILNTIANVVLILENDEKLSGCLAFDDLRKIPVVLRDLPWRKVGEHTKYLVDADDAEFRNYLEVLYGIVNRDKIKDALDIVIHKNTFHPVKDYLESLVWDKVERVDKLLVEFLGAEDSLYVREVTRKTFVAAVARVYQPGIKFDHVLTLVGPQGIGKSRLIARLGGEWYSDTFGSLQNKDAMEQIQGVWLMEIGELAGLKRQEVETIKLFIAKQADRFRVAYGRRVENYPRQCIFIGTTNNMEPLQDQTGNRRFWPVHVVKRLAGLTKEWVDQFWAECCVRYVAGEELYLDESVEIIAKEVQEEYTEQDDRRKMILDFLEMKIPENWADLNIYQRQGWIAGDKSDGMGSEVEREFVTVPDIFLELMKGQAKDMTSFNTKYIRNIMNKLEGWVPKLINRKPYGTQRGWAREGSIAAQTASK